MKVHWLLLIILSSLSLYAQDSLKTIEVETFLAWVKNYHPLAKQAALLDTEAKARLTLARGSFDPKLGGSFDQKVFKESNYYEIMNGSLKIPTWYGIELQGGYENTTGKYLGEEMTLPDDGLWAAGLKLSLGQGLFIDERRANLKKAKVFQDQNTYRQIQVLNELYRQASLSYWTWNANFNKAQVSEESYKIALDRFEQTKQSYIEGDKPAIDTLENYIQVQNRELQLAQSNQEFLTSQYHLNTFLWGDKNTPLELENSIKPAKLTSSISNKISPELIYKNINGLDTAHPKLLEMAAKLEQMEIDQKLKKEYLKPQLDLKYNAIQSPGALLDINSDYLINNYKFGIDFNYSLFLRKERGKLKLGQIKIDYQNLAIDQQELDLKNQISNSLQRLENIKAQLNTANQVVDNYKRLLAGEHKKFEIGESSVFMVNKRESSLLKSQIKAIELKQKLQISYVDLLNKLGILYQL